MQHLIAPERRYLVALDRYVDAGEKVAIVDEAVAASLIEQGWEPGPDETEPAPRSRARTKPPAATADTSEE